MLFSFPRSSLAPILAGVLLFPLPVGLAHQKPEASHREQSNGPEVHYQLALSLQRAGRAEQASHEFAEVERLNQQRRSGTEMPKP
jgi:hypothetical protein